jgi:hypothetical protein
LLGGGVIRSSRIDFYLLFQPLLTALVAKVLSVWHFE